MYMEKTGFSIYLFLLIYLELQFTASRWRLALYNGVYGGAEEQCRYECEDARRMFEPQHDAPSASKYSHFLRLVAVRTVISVLGCYECVSLRCHIHYLIRLN